MASVSDNELALASVYSEAMLTLALDQNQADDLLGELQALGEHLEQNEELLAYFSSPTVKAEARAATIEKAFRGRASDLLVDAMQVLNRKDRLGLILAVVESYRLALEERRGQVDVHVRSAVPLSKAMRNRLKEVATAYAGREAELVERVDESILGGLIIHIEDQKLDTSVATRLKKLGAALAERASLEVHSGRGYTAA